MIGGLADEKVRWADSVKASDRMLINIIGDVMVASGAVSYLGAFTVSISLVLTITYFWSVDCTAYSSYSRSI